MRSISSIRFRARATPPIPSTGQVRVFVDSSDKKLKTIDSTGAVSNAGGASGLPDYELKSADFTAEAGKAYAVDTSGVTVVPAVMPSVILEGLLFTGTSHNSQTAIGIYDDGSLYVGDNGVGELYIYIEDGVTTLQDIVDLMAGEGGPTVVALADGAAGTDLAVTGDSSLTGGSAGSSTPTPMNATLPATPSAGDVIALADARGTWGTNPVVVLRNGAKIEGTESDFTNNAAGTFFSLLYIDSTTGWRVLASGTKPLNLEPPEISGAYFFTASMGAWTGSPASYAYQWQISDNGTSGWTDIDGATSASYLAIEADETKFVRCGVIATNANGPSAVAYSAASVAIEIPEFPVTGLVAFYKLNDNGSGGLDLTDASGNGNTLTNNNAVALGTGRVAGGADFANGGSLSSSAPEAADAFTLSAWVNAPAGLGSFMQLAGVWGNPPFNSFLGTDGDDQAVAVVGDDSGDVVWCYTTTVVRDDTWHFIVAQCDTTNGVFRIKVDDGVWQDGDAPPATLGEGTVFNIGADGSQGIASAGLVDCVGYWNRILTEPEIAQLYNAGNGVEP
jgi:hypothetical protein